MSCNSCSYDCSYDYVSSVSTVCSNADVSGIGVVIGYTVNAGIVVIIILVDYLLAFKPEVDPFLGDQPGAQPRADFKPNPVDKLVIKFIREKCGIHPKLSKSVEDALMKCVLSMSDLQILTGLSILISGFKQIRCGISKYHWSILVYLAWFSSLTHFGCLSFLRNYLFNHPGERAWRLFFMGVIVIMLMVALVPTGLGDYFIKDGSAIICSFKYADLTNHQEAPFINMVLSIVLLAAGLLVRLFKLFQGLSTSITAKIRNPFSNAAFYLLYRVHAWSKIHKSPTGWRRLLVYRPLLAFFLLFRVAIDFYLSMLGEVLWMVISFAWGLVHLTRVRISAHGGENDWSFGQVVPVVLIAAPLLTVFEFLYPDGRKPSLQSTSPSTAPAPASAPAPVKTGVNFGPASAPFTPADGIRDNPDHDFYETSTWFKLFTIFPFVVILEFSVYALILASNQGSVFVDDSPIDADFKETVWAWAFVYCPCFGASYILLALLLEHHSRNAPKSLFSPLFFSCVRGFLIVSLLFFITILSPIILFSTTLPDFPTFFLFAVTYNWLPVSAYVVIYICVAMWLSILT